MDWELKPLKEICLIEKGAIGITKANPGPYPLVTLAEERKEHDEYQFDAKAVIIPLVSSTGHGHASLKRIHYQEGKFALGSILCAVIPKDESTIHPLFLYHYLDVFKERLLVPLMRGMANVTLPIKSLQELEIPVPPIKDQLEWVEKFKTINIKETHLLNELTHQQTLLKQLRQAILQEAVQGKLTEAWRQAHPDVEPASVLLEKIKAEKDRLLQEKKIKKQKPLPPISLDEIPFDLPEDWVWCRLGEICESMTNGIYKPEEYYTDKGIPSLRMYNIQNGYIDFNNVRKILLSNDELAKYKLEIGDLILNRVNSVDLIGKTAIINTDESMVYESMNMRIRNFYKESISPFINTYCQTKYVRSYFQSTLKKAANQVSINQTIVSNLLLPLPPLAEQISIVEKVEKLLAKVSQLEEEVQQNQQRAEQLLQSVLREVMQPKAQASV